MAIKYPNGEEIQKGDIVKATVNCSGSIPGQEYEVENNPNISYDYRLKGTYCNCGSGWEKVAKTNNNKITFNNKLVSNKENPIDVVIQKIGDSINDPHCNCNRCQEKKTITVKCIRCHDNGCPSWEKVAETNKKITKMTTLKDKIRDVVIESLKDVNIGTGDRDGMIHVDVAVDAYNHSCETIVESVIIEIKNYFRQITE